MDPTQLSVTIASAVTGICGGVYAFITEKRTNKVLAKVDQNSEDLTNAKAYKERGDGLALLVDEYRVRNEKEHTEYNEYRKWVHDKAQADAKQMLEHQLVIEELRARPDLRDFMKHLEVQTANTTALMANVAEMVSSVKSLSTTIHELVTAMAAAVPFRGKPQA